MKRFIAILLIYCFLLPTAALAKGIDELTSKSYILMDGQSGNVLLENNADEQLPPASITKIMTMLLAIEAIDSGKLKTTDIVSVSETAAIKEGSHVFLAPGEQISVDDLMKSIAVASGNDAAIAIAETLCGTQEKFVEQMNKRASELNMNNTKFINCNGLDTDGHVSCARDVAIMTFELLKHPKIFDYTTIWMDTLRNGTFQLANTNKLIRFYDGANGMKTGSTSKAGFCLSATAKRNGVQLIAVVMGAPSSKERFADASTLLNYGFQNYSLTTACQKGDIAGDVAVTKGTLPAVTAIASQTYSLLTENNQKDLLKEQKVLTETVEAPVEEGQKLGEIIYTFNGKETGRVPLVALNSVSKLTYGHLFKELINNFLFKI